MNTAQIIEKVNKFKPTSLDEEEITDFINEVESDITLNLYNYNAYTPLSLGDVGRELLAPKQFEKVYSEYVFAKIDLINGEMEKYMLSHDQFNNTYNELGAYITRNNLRVNTTGRYKNYF